MKVYGLVEGARYPKPRKQEGETIARWILGLVLALMTTTATAQTCPGDLNGDGMTTVDELVVSVDAALNGCSDEPGGPGPEITFFGLTGADGTLLAPSEVTSEGVPIFVRLSDLVVAYGFVIVIEAKPSPFSGIAVGTSSYNPSLSGFPDLAIQVDRALGDGSTAVCDDPITMPGGVPGITPSSFAPLGQNIERINDFACRFVDNAGNPVARSVSRESCVNFNGDSHFVDASTTVQFCGFINVPLGFHLGDTKVTVRLRDTEGNSGPSRAIIVRAE